MTVVIKDHYHEVADDDVAEGDVPIIAPPEPGGGSPLVPTTDTFTATADQTEFELTNPPVDGSIRPFSNGARLDDWTLDGQTVVLGTGAPDGAKVLIDYLYED